MSTSILAGLSLILVGCPQSQTPVREAIVSGPSMAPTLVGEHFRVHCTDCGFEFAVDAINSPRSQLAVCPNCGYRDNSLKGSRRRAGEKVTIVPVARPFQRWEVVAVETKQRDVGTVKRVVGLPGESIEILNGNIYVAGQLLRKSLDLQRQTRIHVFDSLATPGRQSRSAPPSLVQRLVPDPASGWRFAGDNDGWTFGPADPANELPAWLTYVHWACLAHPGQRDNPAPVRDNYAYNQAISRNLNPVEELFIRIEVDVAPHAELFLKMQSPGHAGRATSWKIDPARGQLTRSGPGADTATFPCPPPGAATVLELSQIDEQQIFLLNGREICRREIGKPATGDGARGDGARPISIGARRGEVVLKRLQIWRDIHYLDDSKSTYRLGADHYFLLGDNCPVSKDSRTRDPRGVLSSDIIGVVERPR